MTNWTTPWRSSTHSTVFKVGGQAVDEVRSPPIGSQRSEMIRSRGIRTCWAALRDGSPTGDTLMEQASSAVELLVPGVVPNSFRADLTERMLPSGHRMPTGMTDSFHSCPIRDRPAGHPAKRWVDGAPDLLRHRWRERPRH